MLRQILYPKIEGLLTTTALALHRKGLTPNQLTLAGLGINFIAACTFASGHLTLGSLLVVCAGLGDLLDGAVARASNQVTKFGAFLDSVTDRYSDFFLLAGLGVHFVNAGESGRFLLVLGSLAGSFAVSYSKARAENFIPNCSVGFFDRGLRIILLIFGTLIPFFLTGILWLLFIGSNATAIHRVLHTRKILTLQNG